MLNINLLQEITTLDNYLRVMNSEKSLLLYEDGNEIWSLLPKYIIAKCPICNEGYTELLDTYTIRSWVRATFGDEVFVEESKKNRCKHFVRVHKFINFNNFEPEISSKELDYYTSFGSEVPHVLPPLLTDDIESYAVLHSLPICRIEEDKFIPRYTLYMITYYSPENNVEILMDRLRNYKPEIERYEILLIPPKGKDSDIWWDLEHWVSKNKLYWLEPDNPELPLIKGTVDIFPYKNIEGRKWPYIMSVPSRKKSPGFLKKLFKK